jgi:phosphoserine phosphatase
MTLQPQAGVKLVFFDLDGVIYDVGDYTEPGDKVATSTWHVLFDYLGIASEHERLKEMFVQGRFPSYMEWTEEACRRLASEGLTEVVLDKCFASRKFNPGVKATFAELHKRGYRTALITGSMRNLAARAAEELGIDQVVAHCELLFDPAGKLETWQLTPCDYEDKTMYFHRLVREAGLRSEQCAYVGDEVNDIHLFQEAGVSIAFNSHKKVVQQAAQIVIKNPDLREILPYLP